MILDIILSALNCQSNIGNKCVSYIMPGHRNIITFNSVEYLRE